MNASDGVISQIIEAFEEGEDEGSQILTKYAGRYKKDYELGKAKRLLDEYVDGRDSQILVRLGKLLTVLHDARRFHTSGGHGIAVRDRRRFKKAVRGR
ncbi:hypothetical protein ACFLRF_01815 [Candidatus Altiarchaeota archaeon]